MMRKYPKFILFFVILCLIGVGVFAFLNIKKEESAQIQTTQNLKLLTSHSSPQTGEEWVVSFETIGVSDLIIIPQDPDTIGDLDFISLTCNGTKKGDLQILEGDVISYSNWQCQEKGELTHLVNIARKHTLEFQFGDKLAYAYNNPDSITDTFTDTSKVSATSSVVVSGGRVTLAEIILKGNGEACATGTECTSTFCTDGVCCNSACSGTCQACVFSKTGSATGTCANITIDTDPDNECSAVTCTNYIYGWSGNNCVKYSGSSSHNGMCNGSGVCYTTVADSCSGAGATSASCGSSGCKMACVANAYYTSYDTVAECCYTSGQQSCSQCYGCNASGTCEAKTTSCGDGTYGCPWKGCNHYCCMDSDTGYQKCNAGTCNIAGCEGLGCGGDSCVGFCPD